MAECKRNKVAFTEWMPYLDTQWNEHENLIVSALQSQKCK